MSVLQRQDVLAYRNYRYFAVSVVLVVSAVAAYLTVPVPGEHYGGTWLGYTLGIAAALVVLWLMRYGIAKRRPPVPSGNRVRLFAHRAGVRTGGTQQGRLSAHIYLGGALAVLATLHTGFEFGLNVHTLSYVLMGFAIVSGFYGVYAYHHYPEPLTFNEGGMALDAFRERLAELDDKARRIALDLPDEINDLVMASCTGTRLGGNLFQQLRGSRKNCPTSRAVRELQQAGARYLKGNQPDIVRELYTVMLAKEKMVRQVRHRIMLQARLQFWLYFHLPLAIVFFASLVAHIVAILFYW